MVPRSELFGTHRPLAPTIRLHCSGRTRGQGIHRGMKKKTDQIGSHPSQEEKIEEVAKQLREALRPVLRAAAGEDPRPMKLARAIDIDKSLASVLVRAVKAKTDRDLLHIVPS